MGKKARVSKNVFVQQDADNSMEGASKQRKIFKKRNRMNTYAQNQEERARIHRKHNKKRNLETFTTHDSYKRDWGMWRAFYPTSFCE